MKIRTRIPRIPRVLWLLWAACLLFWMAFAGFLSGCASVPVRLENSARLIARPDFDAARAAAPEWARDALKTINALEAQLERK